MSHYESYECFGDSAARAINRYLDENPNQEVAGITPLVLGFIGGETNPGVMVEYRDRPITVIRDDLADDLTPILCQDGTEGVQDPLFVPDHIAGRLDAQHARIACNEDDIDSLRGSVKAMQTSMGFQEGMTREATAMCLSLDTQVNLRVKALEIQVRDLNAKITHG